jgi:hypothetical protein
MGIEKEIADMLNNLEYGEEIRDDILRYAKANKAVIVYGASDDLMEFRGAIEEEVSCFDGFTIHLYTTGILQNECYNNDCPYFEREVLEAKAYITAVWDKGEYSWTYNTNIPNETFEITEDGEKYCQGIVFYLGSLGQGERRDEKDAETVLGDLIATLEDERLREGNLYILYAHNNVEETPQEVAAMGRESGLAKAIEIVKDKLKALEGKRRERQ